MKRTLMNRYAKSFTLFLWFRPDRASSPDAPRIAGMTIKTSIFGRIRTHLTHICLRERKKIHGIKQPRQPQVIVHRDSRECGCSSSFSLIYPRTFPSLDITIQWTPVGRRISTSSTSRDFTVRSKLISSFETMSLAHDIPIASCPSTRWHPHRVCRPIQGRQIFPAQREKSHGTSRTSRRHA